jgi:7-cyano-7-deazaguanine synthase
MSKDKIVTLLSGGLDSTVLLSDLVAHDWDVSAMMIDYGQLHKKELECAKWQCDHYNIGYYLVDARSIFQGMNSPLLGQGYDKIPDKSYAEQLAEKPGTVSTYVPFRNGLLLSIAAARAFAIGATAVAYAAHMDDAAGSAYPDCTLAFVEAMNRAIMEGSGGTVQLHAPFIRGHLTKKDIVRLGYANQVAFDHTWSCYKGGDEPCGTCGTCRDRIAAFKDNGLVPV